MYRLLCTAWKISDDSTSGKLVNSVGRKKGETRRDIQGITCLLSSRNPSVTKSPVYYKLFSQLNFSYKEDLNKH